MIFEEKIVQPKGVYKEVNSILISYMEKTRLTDVISLKNWSRKITCLLIGSSGLFSLEESKAQSYYERLGTSIHQNHMFIDLYRGWGGILRKNPVPTCTETNCKNATLDPNGWPTEDFSLPNIVDTRPFGIWNNGNADDPEKLFPDASGVYHISFKGSAELSSSEPKDRPNGNPFSYSVFQVRNQKYDPATNTSTAEIVLTKEDPQFIGIAFSKTKRTANSAEGTGVTDIKFVKAGHPLHTKQILDVQYMNALAPFKIIRTMDFMNTNGSNPYYGDADNTVDWNERVKPEDVVQRQKQGGAWEYYIATCNLVKKDIWINVPVHATDAYISELAKLLKNTLSPDLNIYVEHSNEVWNFGFQQYTYNRMAARNDSTDLATGKDLNDPSVKSYNITDGLSTAEIAAFTFRRHGKRTYQIMKIFESVFGNAAINTKVRGVFGWWDGLRTRDQYDQTLEWLNWKYGAPKNYLYAIAPTSYFDAKMVTKTETPQEIINLYNEDSDLKATDGEGTAQGKIIYFKNLASKWGLNIYPYEGGPGHTVGDLTNLGNKILAHRLPEMKEAIIRHSKVNTFGTGTWGYVNQLGLVGRGTRFGMWGALEDLNDFSHPKYQAYCELAGRCAGETNVFVETSKGKRTDTVYVFDKISSLELAAGVTTKPGTTLSKVEFYEGFNKIGDGILSAGKYKYTWQPQENGSYAITARVTDSKGVITLAQYASVDVSMSALGVSESTMEPNSIHIFPNPAVDKVSINLNTGSSVYDIAISNAQGNVVNKTTAMIEDGKDFEVSTESLKPGLYFINVSNESQKFVKKLVIGKK